MAYAPPSKKSAGYICQLRVSLDRLDRDGCIIIESGLCGNTVRKYKMMVTAGRISKVRVMNCILGLDVCAIEEISRCDKVRCVDISSESVLKSRHRLCQRGNGGW